MPDNSRESLELLLEVSLLLSSKLDISELLTTIMMLASRVVGAETASLLLVDPATNELYFDVALGLDPALTKVRLQMGQGIAGAVAKAGKPDVINDVRADPRWSPTMDKWSGFVTRSILAVPMSIKGRLIGVVEAINHIEGPFSFQDLRLFEAFASQAAIAIDNARLFASLREEKARLSTVFTEMQDGAVLADEKGEVLLSNAAARKFFSIGGDAPSSLAALDGMPGLIVTPSAADILASDEPLVAFEARREEPKLLILAGTASAVRLEEAGGKAPGGRLILFHDVTEERREEKLKRSFLSLISHKLKTPLASITGYSQLLIEDLAGKSSGLTMKALDTISKQGKKLSEHVDKLLNYTTLEELEEGQMQHKAFWVDEVIAEAVKALEDWLAEQGGKVRFEAGSGAQAYGDPYLIRDVVKNLIENGVKFSAERGKNVAVWARTKNDGVVVCVKDQGAGIPPEEQDKVFNKFYQIESSFTGQVDGWGLGLPFVKKVIERHGGQLSLESHLGTGTTISFTLPCPPVISPGGPSGGAAAGALP